MIVGKKAVNVSIYQVKKTGRDYAGITIHDSTQKEVIEFVQRTINEQNLNQFGGGLVTRIEVRYKQNRKWVGKTKYFSFRGLTPTQTKELLLGKLT